VTATSAGRLASRRALPLLAVIAVAGLVLRARFQAVPLNADESGYAYVARLWSQGYRLYGDTAWVDRGEGLMGAYRVALALGADGAVRSLALVAAAITIVGLYVIGAELRSRPIGLGAAALYAVLSPAPNLEGFTANGELLSEAVVVVAVALAVVWRRRGSPGLLVAAGAAAGAAPFVKQSASDGAIVVLAVVAAAVWARPASERRRAAVRGLLLTALGAAIPVGLCVAHGALVGLGDWWFSLVGYRAGTESVLSGDYAYRLREFKDSLTPALHDLALLFVALPFGLVAARRLRILLVPGVWLAAAFLGFVAGGLYHPHYWMGLVPVLCLTGAIGVEEARRLLPGRLLAVAVAVLLAVTAAFSWSSYAPASPTARSLHSTDDARLVSAPAVARYIDAHTRPSDRIYVIWASTFVYWRADRASAFRYIWYRGVQEIAGAEDGARAVFTGSDPPAAVALYQQPRELDPTGTIDRVLRTRYGPPVRVAGIPVYLLSGSAP
jgi:hypothetical protein